MTSFASYRFIDLRSTLAPTTASPRRSGTSERSAVSRWLKTTRLRARSDLAAVKVRLAYAAFEEQKAGFNEDQPRWPSGSGENSGRWSGGAGAGTTSERVGVEPRLPRGHHYVPRQSINSPEFDLSPAARRVLRRFTTGSLGQGVHLFTAEHRRYNEAVKESLRSFLQDRGISGSQMTAQDAVDFGLQILRSDDRRISSHNKQALRMRLYQLIIRFYLRGRE